MESEEIELEKPSVSEGSEKINSDNLSEDPNFKQKVKPKS